MATKNNTQSDLTPLQSEQNHWKVKTADVTSAFLQSKTLTRGVFVVPVKEADAGDTLWRLKKPMHGLEDSGRYWYLTIAEKLVELGCSKLDTDHAVFSLQRNGILQGMVTLHVDDLQYMGNKEFEQQVMNPLFITFIWNLCVTGLHQEQVGFFED